MSKHITAIFLAVLLVLTTLLACSCDLFNKPNGPGGDDDEDGKIKYEKYDESTVTFQDNSDAKLSNYNPDLYYINEWQAGFNAPGTKANYFPDMGDPMIVYDDGYYYAFGTRQATCFHCFRSKDFTTWERLSDAFTPASGSWSRADLWAPDIQKIGNKWYMYYTARMDYSDGAKHCQIGVAVADKPYGPYVQYTGINANGENVTLADTPFKGLEYHTILDQTVFQDDNGDLYMYFSYDSRTGSPEHMNQSKTQNAAEIWGVKMKDPVTWDLSTLTPLVSPGYKAFDDEERTIAWETWSPSFANDTECCEGPYMIKHGGKYFLTYCANSFVDAEYAVGYAVSDKPLEGFVKPDDTYLQNMLLGVPGEPGTYINNRYKGFTRGTGHASIFKTGDGGDYMFAYHAHFDRNKWDDKDAGNTHANWRALAVDYLYFDGNGSPYTNGPTYSLQRTPTNVSGYSNLISQAAVKAEGEHPEYLYDNYTNRACVSSVGFVTEKIKETDFKAGTRSIEIKFNKEITVVALNIFNSCDLSKAVMRIDQIDFGNSNGIVNAQFNQRYINKEQQFIFPHSAFNIELGSGGVKTDRIVITISSDVDFALGEIEIIGK